MGECDVSAADGMGNTASVKRWVAGDDTSWARRVHPAAERVRVRPRSRESGTSRSRCRPFKRGCGPHPP